MVKAANRAVISFWVFLLCVSFSSAESIKSLSKNLVSIQASPYSTDGFRISSKSPLNGLTLDLDEEMGEYSFLLAGHLYGAPENRRSVFPSSSFLANMDKINSIGARFFVSLGDNYRRANSVHIANYITSVASKLEMPLFNSVGNHDLTSRDLYEANFGKTYYHFAYNSELFVFLDSELDAGSITGDQLDFLLHIAQSAIENPDIRNVFIFSHKLIWSVNNPDYRIVFDHLNARSGYTDTDNFENDIKPILTDLSEHKAVYWVSGDIGCSWSLSLFFEKDRNSNVTYIATGIGDTERDAILQVNVSKSGDEVAFTPISLTGQELQPMEYYGVDYWESHFGAEAEDGKRLRMFKHKYFWAGVFASWLFLGFVILILRRFRQV